MTDLGKCELLQAVNESAFVLQELALYLDTHPCCSAGLARFQQARQAYCQAVDAYVSQYGPLRFEQSEGCSSWQWVEAPWPWEMED
jgi:spore coat protein JB